MTAEDLLPLLNIYRLAAWLESKPADDIVGESVESEACPLANYLREEHDIEAIVEKYRVYLKHEDVSSELPEPLCKFVEGVDAGRATETSYTNHYGDIISSATAAGCLKLIGEIKGEWRV